MSRERIIYDPTNCPRCDQFARYGTRQVFGFVWNDTAYTNPGPYYFDVRAARRIVRDGRAPRHDTRKNVGLALAQTTVYPGHLNHVDTRLIPIVAKVPLDYLGQPGGTTGMPFIDGKHVAARRLIEGAGRVYFYALTEEETRRVIIPDLTAWGLAHGRMDMIENVILLGGDHG
jgi:hypothetical protein